MKRKFSDLHCHNHMRAHFQMQEKQKKFTRKGEFSPWTVIASNSKAIQNGKMGASYSQIDLVKCWNANLRLTFNSLYPLEREFVQAQREAYMETAIEDDEIELDDDDTPDAWDVESIAILRTLADTTE